MEKRILLLMLLALCCTGCESQSKSTIQENQWNLTDTESISEYLTGTWVNELGFVCEYQEDYFIDQRGIIYEDCNITNHENADFYIIESADQLNDNIHKSIIQVMDDDTIKVDTVTAYRAESDKARTYMMELKRNIIGKWNYSSEEDEQSMEFTEDEMITMEEDFEERASYELCDAKLLVSLGEEDNVTVYIQLNGDELTLREAGDELQTHRME